MAHSLTDAHQVPRRVVAGLLILLVVTGSISLASFMLLPQESSYIIQPTLASVAVFIAFSLILKSWVGDHLFGEIGFLYMVFGLAYTIFPAFTFLILELDVASGWVWQNLTLLLPAPYELGIHLWRHVLFLLGVSAGYLLFRGRTVPDMGVRLDPEGKDRRTILFLLGVLLVSMVCISLLSAPVKTYIDNYTRFDHLSWGPRKFVSLCNRLKQGIYVALITFLFMNFKKYRWITLFVVVSMGTYEVVDSFGSRIESLIVLLMAICLFHFFVKPVTIKKGIVVLLAIGVLFSVVEILRAYEFDLSRTGNVVSSSGMQPASEFGAVYFTGFHLYAERAQGTLPAKEWPMFFNDFISLVTPNDFVRWHPQYWYARIYFPNDVVPPQTMGPIADSGIWGGELDLLIRSLLNGALFAYIVRWFIKYRSQWWGVAVYVFCYATCVMTLKYSIFYHLNPLLKTFIPIIFLVSIFRHILTPGEGLIGKGPSVK